MTKNRLGFRSAHPVSALLFFVLAVTASTASTHPLTLGICFCSAAVCDIALQGKKAARLLTRVLLPMLALVSAFNGLYNHYGVTVLFRMRSGNNSRWRRWSTGWCSPSRPAAPCCGWT